MKDFEHGYRLLMPDGSVKHVHASAHAANEYIEGEHPILSGQFRTLLPRKEAEAGITLTRWRTSRFPARDGARRAGRCRSPMK